MQNAIQRINQRVLSKQGSAARMLDRMPRVVQTSIVKALKYPFAYPELDSFSQALMAIQHKQGISGIVGEDVIASRQLFESSAELLIQRATAVAQVKDLKLPLRSGEIDARHYHPAPNKKLPMLVFYHGGGFVVGSRNSHDEVCRLIAIHSKVQVLSIEYPLAPEVGPVALIKSCEDALAWVYQNRNQFKILKNRIAVAGDSAGGNIATVIAQRTKNTAYAPQAQFLIYPTVDFKSRHPSFYMYKDGLILTGQDVDLVTEYYALRHGIELDDPLISPTYGDIKKLAATFIATAGHDILHDEGKIYAYKLKQHGVHVHYREYADQIHGFINLTPISRKAKKYLIEMSKDFRRFWDKSC
ncbi:alpha/beta hydrolase [Acinetobacter rudis]|uniref:alpha/beta hydrolase n=1 Tax=Acinetobacter rudis TaxID=632955 RepID=UPI00333F0930